MNPKKLLKHINGKEYPKSFPSEEEYRKLPKIKDKDKFGNPIEKADESKLERETVGNVIMNCLARYKPEEPKENIFVNIAMQLLWDEKKEVQLKDKIRKFVIKVVVNQTIHDEFLDDKNPKTKTEVGTYWSWVTGQALAELGAELEEVEEYSSGKHK